MRFKIIENLTFKKSLQEFYFSQIGDILRIELHLITRGEVYKKSCESVLALLFETKI